VELLSEAQQQEASKNQNQGGGCFVSEKVMASTKNAYCPLLVATTTVVLYLLTWWSKQARIQQPADWLYPASHAIHPSLLFTAHWFQRKWVRHFW